MARRARITEQDDRYLKNKKKAELDPAGIASLIIINLEDLADQNDDFHDEFVDHCEQPAGKAHPSTAAQPAPGDLTRSQRYKLEVMKHRGKIIASIAGIVLGIMAIVFKATGV